MTKNDLKTGMFVRISDGRMYLVLRDTGMNDTGTTGKDVLINIHSHGWLNLKDYNEDLTYCCYDSLEKKFNIEEVYRAMDSVDLCDVKKYVKIWSRDKTKNKEIKEHLLKEVPIFKGSTHPHCCPLVGGKEYICHRNHKPTIEVRLPLRG